MRLRLAGWFCASAICAALFGLNLQADETAKCCDKSKAECTTEECKAPCTEGCAKQCPATVCADKCKDGQCPVTSSSETCSDSTKCEGKLCEAGKCEGKDGSAKCCDTAKCESACKDCPGGDCPTEATASKSITGTLLPLLTGSKSKRPKFTFTVGLSMTKPSDEKSSEATAAKQAPVCNVGECKDGECKDGTCPAGSCKPNCVVVHGESIACESTDCEKSACESQKGSMTTITVAGKPSCSKEGEFEVTSICPDQTLASELGCDGEFVFQTLSDEDLAEMHSKHVPPVPFAVSTLTSAVPTPPQAIHVTQMSPSMFELIKQNAELKVKLEMMEAMFEMQEEMNAKLMELAIENARLTTMLAKESASSNSTTATVSTESSAPRCTTVALLKSKPAAVVHDEPTCPSVPSVPSVQLSGAHVEVETTESLKLPLRMKIDTNELIEQVIQAVEMKNKQGARY